MVENREAWVPRRIGSKAKTARDVDDWLLRPGHGRLLVPQVTPRSYGPLCGSGGKVTCLLLVTTSSAVAEGRRAKQNSTAALEPRARSVRTLIDALALEQRDRERSRTASKPPIVQGGWLDASANDRFLSQFGYDAVKKRAAPGEDVYLVLDPEAKRFSLQARASPLELVREVQDASLPLEEWKSAAPFPSLSPSRRAGAAGSGGSAKDGKVQIALFLGIDPHLARLALTVAAVAALGLWLSFSSKK